MTTVSMTLPQMYRGECVLGDLLIVKLTPCELSLVALLLVSPPNKVVDFETIIEAIWPDPDTQPLTTTKIISVIKYRLKLKGIPLEACWGQGIYSIPAESRGSRRTMRRARNWILVDDQWRKAA